MEFKNWLITEELYLQNNTAVVYHRTDKLNNVSGLLSQIFKTNACAYGCGLYGFINLNSQFSYDTYRYGDIITKWKVSGLDKFLILTKDLAQKIHSSDHLISSQLKKLGVFESWKQVAGPKWEEIIKKYDEKPTDKFAEDYGKWAEKNITGVLYYDYRYTDGLVLLKYQPIEQGVTFLGYVEAPYTGSEKAEEIIPTLKWQKHMKGTSMKSLYQARVSGRDISDKILNVPPLTLTPANFEGEPTVFKKSPVSFSGKMEKVKQGDKVVLISPPMNNYPADLKQGPFSGFGKRTHFFKFLDESQWYITVSTKDYVFKINDKAIPAGATTPLNSGDNLCIKTKDKEYCFSINSNQKANIKPKQKQIKSYVIGKINLDLVGRELIFHGSRGDHRLSLNPQQMQQLTGITAESTEAPIFGTAPPRIDWSKKGREVIRKYFNVNKQLANGSQTVKLTGNTITIDDKPLIQLTPEQTQDLTSALNDVMQIKK